MWVASAFPRTQPSACVEDVGCCLPVGLHSLCETKARTRRSPVWGGGGGRRLTLGWSAISLSATGAVGGQPRVPSTQCSQAERGVPDEPTHRVRMRASALCGMLLFVPHVSGHAILTVPTPRTGISGGATAASGNGAGVHTVAPARPALPARGRGRALPSRCPCRSPCPTSVRPPGIGTKLAPFASAGTLAAACGGVANSDPGVERPLVAFSPGGQVRIKPNPSASPRPSPSPSPNLIRSR